MYISMAAEKPTTFTGVEQCQLKPIDFVGGAQSVCMNFVVNKVMDYTQKKSKDRLKWEDYTGEKGAKYIHFKSAKTDFGDKIVLSDFISGNIAVVLKLKSSSDDKDMRLDLIEEADAPTMLMFVDADKFIKEKKEKTLDEKTGLIFKTLRRYNFWNVRLELDVDKEQFKDFRISEDVYQFMDKELME